MQRITIFIYTKNIELVPSPIFNLEYSDVDRHVNLNLFVVI
jgi:hypothetical protein